MLKVFLTAVATGAIVLAILNGFGYVKLQPKAAAYAADALGGLLLGAGISLSGACPGTARANRRRLPRCAVHACRRTLRCGHVLLCAADAGQNVS
jgi:hypothetical protein